MYCRVHSGLKNLSLLKLASYKSVLMARSILTEEELRRYSRNIILPDIGEAGQQKLKKAKVLVIGAGGLGSPALLYLAATGIGHIGIIDSDKVELSNLQRQIIHETGDISRPKAESARDALHDLNPLVHVESHTFRLTEKNAAALIPEYDIILDGSDNIGTRFLVNDTCHAAKKSLVSGAIVGFQGQVSVFKSHIPGNNPCYRCLYPEPPPEDAMPSCAENGVFSPLGGIMGSLMAAEAIKELTGAGESLSGYVLLVDLLKNNFRKVKLNRDSECSACNG